MSVLKPVYNIYQLKMYPFLNILTFGCRFPCRADNTAYPHDGRADKRRYRHDRRADSQCRIIDSVMALHLVAIGVYIKNRSPH